MFSKFIASIIASVSEEMLLDFFRAIFTELTLDKDKAALSKAVDHLKQVVDETKTSEASDDEKNKLLIDAGRGVADRLRKR